LKGRSKSADGSPLIAPKQDWGWAYQILPYIEQDIVWRMPNDTDVAAQPIALYFCPSRRPIMYWVLPGEQSGMPDGPRGQLDYAGCGGTDPIEKQFPSKYAGRNGMMVRRPDGLVSDPSPSVTLATVPDGSTNTLMIGERNVNAAKLGDSSQWDENNGYFDGYDWDTIRWGIDPPAPDRFDNSIYDWRFGSRHPAGFNGLFGDGSVRLIGYNIVPETFRRLCCRDDGLPVSADGL
jgi:prepilin-type processing-associated H-X9-DG protein